MSLSKPVLRWENGPTVITAGTSWLTLATDGKLIRVRDELADLRAVLRNLLGSPGRVLRTSIGESPVQVSHLRSKGNILVEAPKGNRHEFAPATAAELCDWLAGSSEQSDELGLMKASRTRDGIMLAHGSTWYPLNGGETGAFVRFLLTAAACPEGHTAVCDNRRFATSRQGPGQLVHLEISQRIGSRSDSIGLTRPSLVRLAQQIDRLLAS